MAKIVNRHAADVHANPAGFKRDEFFLGAAEGVENAKHQGFRRRAPWERAENQAK
jgi:hypothetical protein